MSDDMVPLREHLDAIRALERRIEEERDRRYSEVAAEREKALRIKEKADEQALDLARDIQTYKDEKANELREQINQERGAYVTQQQHQALLDRLDTALNPIQEFIAAERGHDKGVSATTGLFLALPSLVATIIGIALLIRGL